MRKTYLLAVLTLVVVALFVSGCIDTDYTIGLSEDGSQSIKVNMKAPSGLDATKLQELQDDLSKAGYTVKKTTDKDQNIIITGEKTNPSGKWELPYNAKVVAADPKFTQNFSNYFVYKAWSFEGSYDFDQKKVNELVGKPEETEDTTADQSGMSMEDYSLDFVYNITVPGTLGDNNATSTVSNSDGTSTLTWKYNTDKDKGVNIKLNSSKTYTTYMAIAGGIVVLIILIPIVLAVTKKKKPAPPSYQPPADFPPAGPTA